MRQHRGGTLCAPHPHPRGKFTTQGLAYKVLGCWASFEEGEKWSCRGQPDGKSSSPGAGCSPAPQTLRAFRGAARMGREALHRTGGARGPHWLGLARRCLIYPRPRGGQQQVLPELFHHPAGTCGFRARGARRGPRPASRSPLHVPRHPKSLHCPRWAPSSGRSAQGALHGCPVLSPSSSPPRGRTSLPVFCRDRRPFCWGTLSWRPSGGLVASVPSAGSKVANTRARVTNWPSHSAHMVLGVNLPPGDLESLCSPPPPPSLLPLLFPLFLLARLPPRGRRWIEVTQRPPVALRRACDRAVSSTASARQWQ